MKNHPLLVLQTRTAEFYSARVHGWCCNSSCSNLPLILHYCQRTSSCDINENQTPTFSINPIYTGLLRRQQFNSKSSLQLLKWNVTLQNAAQKNILNGTMLTIWIMFCEVRKSIKKKNKHERHFLLFWVGWINSYLVTKKQRRNITGQI